MGLGTPERGDTLRGADLVRVFSPLLFFAAHLVYLAAWSPDPFLKKWLDGSFTFFVALALCNIIRVRVLAASEARRQAAARDEEAGGKPPT